jgi:predicted transcriptional regulator/ribosome-associated translation inhibitor RaiA
MRVNEIMSTDVITVGPDEAASTAWSRMTRERIRHLVVTEGRQVLGIISDRDLGGRTGGAVRRGRTVRDLMTPQVATAAPDMTLRKAANLMHGRLIGSLPVMEGTRLVGIVTATDVLQALGRGSTRPSARAERRARRLAPATARRAAANRTRSTAQRSKRARAKHRANAKGATDSGGREPQPDSAQRSPMANSIPRAAKRTTDRASPTDTPAHIRAVGVPLSDADKAYLRRKLGRKLGKFARSIERTSVRIEDVNGPRGGTDKLCRIKVVLSGLPSVVVEERHQLLQAAMDGALARVGRAVSAAQERRGERRRTRASTSRGYQRHSRPLRSDEHGASMVPAAAVGRAETHELGAGRSASDR